MICKIHGSETVKTYPLLIGSSDAEFTLYMSVYIWKQKLCATELEKSQYADANNQKNIFCRKKKKKKDRQFKLLLHSLMIHLFSWALNAEFWAVQRKPQVALIMIICSRWMLQMCNKCIGGIYCINTLILFLSIYIHNPIPLYCMIYLSSS